MFEAFKVAVVLRASLLMHIKRTSPYKRPSAQTVQSGELKVGCRQISVITELLRKTMAEEKRVSENE